MGMLTEAEFEATMGRPMSPVEEETPVPADFWAYVERIDPSDLHGYELGEGNIQRAYREAGGRYDHVLLGSNDVNVFLVIVIDRVASAVHGHHLLDLARLYGLR